MGFEALVLNGKNNLRIGIFFTNLHGRSGASAAEISYYEQIKLAALGKYKVILIYNKKDNLILNPNSDDQYLNLKLSLFSKIKSYILSPVAIQDILTYLKIYSSSAFEKKLKKK